jgi:hypothetical protein
LLVVVRPLPDRETVRTDALQRLRQQLGMPGSTSTSSCAAELRAVEANQQFLDQQSIIEDDVHY